MTSKINKSIKIFVAEVDLLIGDASKAQQKLGWKPKYNLDSLIEEMVTSDVRHLI